MPGGTARCCYARQTKFWISDPDRALWEIVRVLHPIEPLLLDRRDQLPVFEKDGRGIMAAVISAVVFADDLVAAVHTENQHQRLLRRFGPRRSNFIASVKRDA